MRQIGKLAARIGAVIIGISVVAASDVPVYAYNAPEGAEGSDVAVTFVFTPKTSNTDDNEENKGSEEGSGGKDDNSGEGESKEQPQQEEGNNPVKPEEKKDDEVKPEQKGNSSREDYDEESVYVRPVSYTESVKPEAENEEIVVEKTEKVERTGFSGEYKKDVQKSVTKEKKQWDMDDVVPYIAVATLGVVTIGAAASGGLSGLWILLLGLLFKKKKKHWSGLLTYTPNLFMTVKGRDEHTEDMQDILNRGASVEELRALMEESGVETILPVNTKMVIDIDGAQREFDADEEIFYRELAGKKGDFTVSFYNGAARLEFDVIKRCDI
ncbi:MAG: hypothetical protein IJJ64_11215 [Butyrivibrio sp.]|nr:hypothetical protein [Butyrivibrio sp.]MBQ7614078.1 hypothetical protein [Butyrivibrio sp.]